MENERRTMENLVIHTLGYEGATLAEFITRLKMAGIMTVADVRQMPLSRKRGFSKTALAAALEKVGIDYVHIPALGCPKPIRERYRLDARVREASRREFCGCSGPRATGGRIAYLPRVLRGGFQPLPQKYRCGGCVDNGEGAACHPSDHLSGDNL
jgi:hypothetical protein